MWKAEAVFDERDAARIGPLTLAYIGDAVFELYVRLTLLGSVDQNAGKLHKRSIGIVNARAQAGFARRVQERLTERESEIFVRGRNAKSATVPKNMSVADYHYATAIEAVIGYLHLSGQQERLNELLAFVFEGEETGDEK